MIGRALSHYKILSEISRGSMGIVYRALDLKLDREVALKVLPTELVADSERKRRFTQEAKAAAKLNHPHVGMVFEIDEVDGFSFIAMELIRGEQLRDTIARGPVPLRRALEIASIEHVWWPIEYVRSFYFLGKIHENRGEMEKAREYYRRFYECWRDGDMDRERVEEGRKKLAS